MSKKKVVKKAYCCGVDFQHDIEGEWIKIYSNLKSLKKAKPCWTECGIVELEVSIKKWIAPQDFAYRKKVDDATKALKTKDCSYCKGLGHINKAVDISDYYPVPCPKCRSVK